MRVHIETNRLVMRDIEPSDAEGIFALDSDPEVHKYLGNNPIKTMAEAEEIIEYIRQQYEKNGIGRWAVIDKQTEDFIGWSGLKLEDKVRDFSYYDLGYRLRRAYWGKGIASETAVESLKYGFSKLNLNEISALADVNHIASNKVLRKAGLRFIEIFHYEGVTPCNWYKITKSEWIEQSRS